jgi:hypothetical protein
MFVTQMWIPTYNLDKFYDLTWTRSTNLHRITIVTRAKYITEINFKGVVNLHISEQLNSRRAAKRRAFDARSSDSIKFFKSFFFLQENAN